MNQKPIRNSSAGTAAQKSSKISWLARHALLLAIPMLSAVFCQAQIKIGDITISDSMAKMYFANCYFVPDTIRPQQEYGLPDQWGLEQNRLIRERNEELKRRSIGFYNGYLIPRKPSDQDFIKWLSNSR